MLEASLASYFGFSSFRPGQKEVVSQVVAKQSSIAIFPTGAGKSLCYQLPAQILPHLTLVVSPLLSLMKDQLDFLLGHDIQAARLDSTLSRDDYFDVLKRAKNGQLKILMISVERFKNERFRAQLKQMKISLLVIDEAHCISEWGHNFRPDYLKLPSYQKSFNISQVLLLTATATPQVIQDMCAKFNIEQEQVVITGFYRKNLCLQVSPTSEPDKPDRLLERVQADTQAPTIVYVTLQKTAENVAAFLAEKGVNAQAYHAGMPSDQREVIQNRFMQGELNCIVATIAFGMGIDKKDIRRVIHYDLPKSIENYAQEIGRSGRDGGDALCEILANREHVSVLENFVFGDTPEKASIKTLLAGLKESESPFWELQLSQLSKELNLKTLPLKTLLVYLELEGIIQPLHTHFSQYSLKFFESPENISARFKGERKDFVDHLFSHSQTKKVWTTVDITSCVDSYPGTDRARVLTALEYFEQKSWIELQAKKAVETYRIVNQSFDLEKLTLLLSERFKNKETSEVQRIHNMLQFFECESCLSQKLALYFGEDIQSSHCGHCSVCLSGRALLPESSQTKKNLYQFDLVDLTKNFREQAGQSGYLLNLTKFLCGIHTPHFTKLKAKKLPGFGILENYPFLEVKAEISKQLY